MVRNNYSSLQLRHEVKTCISQLQKRHCLDYTALPGWPLQSRLLPANPDLIVSLSEWFGLNPKRFLLLYCQWLLEVHHIGWLGTIL